MRVAGKHFGERVSHLQLSVCHAVHVGLRLIQTAIFPRAFRRRRQTIVFVVGRQLLLVEGGIESAIETALV